MSEMPPGTAFADHLIRGVLGRGGMGIVYRATHVALERDVALKVIAPEFSQDEEFRRRFRREARATAAIGHPNVIGVHHAGEHDGLLYVTMRYVDGTDLARLLAAEGRLDPELAATVIAQVAAALDAAHRAGIVHRDVKPANVLLETEGDGMRATLTDFGLMKDLRATSQITQAGSLIGTFDYAAPEQLREGPVDARTDVYALGAVLYQALTGRVPFPRETAAATMLAQLDSPPPSVLSVRPDCSERLGDVVRRAMAKAPEDRYPSAGDLGRAVTAAVRDQDAGEAEHSVATGDASPGRTRSPVIPLPAALAIETGHGPFVGRAAPLAKLEARFAAAAAGERQFVLLTGEPGIGKTRLAGELARRAHGGGATVLYGRNDPESLVPYHPFIAALQHYVAHREQLRLPAELALELSELARFIPALRAQVPEARESLAEDADTRRYRLFEGVTRMLAFAARERPVVLLLDDLHWADASTTRLLGHLLRDAAPMRLLVLGTARSFDDEQLTRRRASFERVELSGLTTDETAALVGRDDVGSRFVRRLTEETSGNPFFIEETLRSLPELEERALSRIAVPEGVKELIARRLQQLSPTANQVLSVAAIVGRQFDLALLETLLDEPADDIIDALEEATRAGLIRETDAARPVRLRARARARDALREPEREPPRARAPPDRRGAGAPRRREPGRARLPLPRRPGAARPSATRWPPPSRRWRRSPTRRRPSTTGARATISPTRLALGAAELRAGDPAARATFAAAAAIARAAGDRDALAAAALGHSGRHAEAGVIDHEAIALLEEALASHPEDGLTGVRLRARLVDQFGQTAPARR